MWYKTGKEYVELPELKFPIHLKTDFVIEELQGTCRDCNKPIQGLRGEVREYDQCSEVLFVGLCHNCNTVVTCCFRHYKDGRILEPSREGDKWNVMTATIPFRYWFKHWKGKIFGYKKKSDNRL